MTSKIKIEPLTDARTLASGVPSTIGSGRLLSLDVTRGLAVVGMILVVSAGSWDHRYRPLLHADWYGWTLADMIFPLFLFAVGLAITYSFCAHLSAESRNGPSY